MWQSTSPVSGRCSAGNSLLWATAFKENQPASNLKQGIKSLWNTHCGKRHLWKKFSPTWIKILISQPCWFFERLSSISKPDVLPPSDCKHWVVRVAEGWIQVHLSKNVENEVLSDFPLESLPLRHIALRKIWRAFQGPLTGFRLWIGAELGV